MTEYKLRTHTGHLAKLVSESKKWQKKKNQEMRRNKFQNDRLNQPIETGKLLSDDEQLAIAMRSLDRNEK